MANEKECVGCKTVPYAVIELENRRHQRMINWLCSIILILIILLVGTNVAWLHAEQEGNGGNQIVGGDYNGQTED